MVNMVRYRIHAIIFLFILGAAVNTSAVDELQVEKVGDPDLLPIIFTERQYRDDEARRLPVRDQIQVYRAAGPGQDTAITVRASNTVLGRDNPAVFSYFNQITQTVIDDDPVRATISGFAFYYDREAQRKSLIAGAYRNDSALAIKLIPGTDRSEVLFLCTGSDHTGNDRWEPSVQTLLVEDYDYDGSEEAFIYVSPGRDLEPRELFCVDPQRLVVEWSLPVASVLTPGSLHSCRDSLDPGVIFTTANVKNGVVDPYFDDRYSYLARVDSRGQPRFRFIISEEHSGGGLWPAERNGVFYLVSSLPMVAPEEAEALPPHRTSLSKIDGRGNVLYSADIPWRLADTWISEYKENGVPCLYTLSSTGVVSVYDTSLVLQARSRPTRLRGFLCTLRIEQQDRPAFLFHTSSGLDLYSHDFKCLGRFPKPYRQFHPLVFNNQGGITSFVVSALDRDGVIHIQRRPLLEYGQILFWKYQNTILIVLTLLVLTLVIVNSFRQRAVRQLRESEARFREMTDLLPQGVFEIGPDRNVTFGNREALRMYGLTQAEIDAGLDVAGVVIPEDRERLEESMSRVIKGERTGGIEYTALRRDGSTFPILTYSAGVQRNGQVVGVRGVVMDITERRRTEQALRESEYKWRSLVENIPDVIFTTDIDARILSIERTRSGVSKEDVIGTIAYDWVAPEQREPLKQAVARVFRSGSMESIEVLTPGPDGPETVWYLTRLVPMMRDGEVECVEFINTNITERKKAQEALQRSEENYRSLVESAEEAIFTFDREGVYLFMNHVAAKRLGHTPEEVIGRPMIEFFPPDIARRQLESIREVFDTGKSKTVETLIEFKDVKRWYRTSLQPVRYGDEEILSVMCIARDITEAVETQRALGTERGFVRSMLDTSNSLVLCLDKEACITVFNKECERITGWKQEEVLGKYWPDLFVPRENHRHTRENFAEWVRQHPSDTFEDPIITRNGEIRIILWSNSAIFYPGTDDFTAIAVGQDITKRKRAEKRLQESERKYRSLVEYSLQAIFIIQGEKVVLANRRLAELLGVDQRDLDGADLVDVLDFVLEPEVRQRLGEAHRALLANRRTDDNLELRVRSTAGREFWVEAIAHRDIYEGEPAVIMVLIDVSDRKAAQARLEAINREKYEQAKHIAGGFAHEMRNALFPAEGALYRLVGPGRREKALSETEVRKYSAAAAAAVSRTIDITELISYYTGLDSGHNPETVPLKPLVDEVFESNGFAVEDLGVQVTLEGLENLAVVSNRQQLYLAVNNLLLNSLDALTEQKLPAIFVKAVKEPGSVKVVFGDNGCGISPDDLSKVFDTFFSSKPNKGTGLGLAMSRQIIEMYGGTIQVESVPGEGAAFELVMLEAGTDG